MIREGKINQISSFIRTGTSIGMQTMDQHLKQLIAEGKITKEAAARTGVSHGFFRPLP
jgi:twitching motility protein PilT